MEVKPKKCKAEGCNNTFTPSYSTLQKYCSSQCAYAENKKAKANKGKPKPKRINPISDKRAKELIEYGRLRKEFLTANPKCAIHGTNCKHKATTVEHTKGRQGFADEEARANNISLLVDVRYWLPACNPCNLELESNPELSKQHQLSKIHNGKKI